MEDDENGAIVPIGRVGTLLGDELSANKFLVGNAGKSFPRFRNANPRFGNSKFLLNSGLGKTSHGKISEIKQRFEDGGCALCHLIFEAVRRYSGENVNDDSECFMVWEVDGRQAAKQPGLTTKHNGNDKDDRNASLSNVSRRIKMWWAQKDGSEMDAYILFLASSDKVLLHTGTTSMLRDTRQAVFLGQDFDVAKPKSALFKSWLDTCEDQHKSRSCDTGYVYDPARFVNLIQATWFGVIDVIRMRICRLPVDEKTKMPSRYIALSYDSTFSWELNADEMDLVYGNAYLTICAADGQDDEAGLRALDVKTADTPLKAELGNGLRLLVSRPSESTIRDSTWNQRGWTFQERILSRRCLVFSGGRVYFQCRSGNMSQDIGPDTSGQGLSMDWKTSPLRTLDELKERPIWFYMTSVSLYTGRRLTFAKDILAAYKGVSRLIEPYMQGPVSTFVYGLPPSHFDLALLWSPLSAQTRRKPTGEHDARENDLPSWSWAGWMDLHDEKKGSPVKYQQDMLDGCLIDTHEWLSKHTWIKWFIRNSAGDLRPIWDKGEMPRVEGVLGRWRGYATNEESYLPSMVRTKLQTPSEPRCGVCSIIRGERLKRRTAFTRNETRSTTETEDTESTRTERFDERDEYGRQIRWRKEQAKSSTFCGSIPDNPFGVNVVGFNCNTQRRDRPILQFWTWRTRFFVVHNEEATKASPPGDGLVRCDIADDNADWCGHIVLNESYIKAKESDPRMEFIALSDAKSFTKEECPNWAHYIPQAFDDIEWDLFFVMLIEWDKDSLAWERVGLGKIVQAAFHGSSWDEVLLG
ncbi:hypothetical protein G7054_g2594 [Neopestalotiopsis clavispora]|nr:hypothetical protein G7054_g2594 [Neopestalotiopsis clavispora]